MRWFYSNAYTAQFVIEKERVFTKNSNLPHGHGELQLNKFEPFPKNPPISKVFREIGYADELGSGMRNTNMYTKLYSGGTPIFVEDNIFEIVIPMGSVAKLQVGPEETSKEIKETNKEIEKTSKETSKEIEETGKEIIQKIGKEICNKIIDILEMRPEIAVKEVAQIMDMSVSGVRYHIEKMKKAGIIEHIGSTKKGKWVVHK